MRSRKAVIIGAGMGGLAAAIRLAGEGWAVTVVEKALKPGGKLRALDVGGQAIDAGPTVFTMRWVFEELLGEVGRSLSDLVTLQPAQVLARHAWTDGGRLDLFADVKESADAVGAFAGAAEARAYLDFCARARRIYGTLRDPFIRSSRPSPIGLMNRVGISGLGDLARISPFKTLWRALEEHFQDARLRQLFGRYATYCGSSPFNAPATLMLVAHVEQDGVWLVEGGMVRLAEALAKVAGDLGVVFRFGEEASRVEIKNGRANAVTLTNGDLLTADAIILNADVAALAEGLFGNEAKSSATPVPRESRSLSAVTWCLVAKAEGFPMSRHNVFFSNNYRAEFDDIFQRRRLPRAPSVYICAQDRNGDFSSHQNANIAPERLFIIVNAPADGDLPATDATEINTCEEATFGLLGRCGLHLGIQPERAIRTTPEDYNSLFPATGGALYGRSSHGWMASFQRPGSRTQLPGLYTAGGSVHPGPGLPMAALSGVQAAMSVMEDYDSMFWSHPAATAGGTRTP